MFGFLNPLKALQRLKLVTDLINKVPGLSKVLKLTPIVSQVFDAVQAAVAFASAIAKGDIAGAFKSLIGPALQIALASVPLGTALQDVGAKLADNLDKVMGPVLDQIGSTMGQAAESAMRSQLTNFETYLKSPAFTTELTGKLKKGAADAITQEDMTKLFSSSVGGTSFLTDVMAGYIGTDLKGLSIMKDAFPPATPASAISTFIPKEDMPTYTPPARDYTPVSSATSSTAAASYVPFSSDIAGLPSSYTVNSVTKGQIYDP